MIASELLIGAYRAGLFPMPSGSGQLEWYAPDPRGIIPLDDRFHIPHGLARTLRKNLFAVRINTAFEPVMRGCAERLETWITDEIVDSYCALYRKGLAHSVECWEGDELVGGLYGVAIGGAFFGESMFHRKTDASKVALVALVSRLRARGFSLLDTQWTTAHLRTFGACDISSKEYRRQLSLALQRDCAFADPPSSDPSLPSEPINPCGFD